MGLGFYSFWLEVENNGHASGERPLKTRQGHRRPFLSTQGLGFFPYCLARSMQGRQDHKTNDVHIRNDSGNHQGFRVLGFRV